MQTCAVLSSGVRPDDALQRRVQAVFDHAGNQAISPDTVETFARTALAQRVEVADKEVRIMGSKSELLRTLVAAPGGKSAALGVQSSVLKWRARKDSASDAPIHRREHDQNRGF